MDLRQYNDLEVRNLLSLTSSEIEALAQLKVSAWQEIKGGSFIESVEGWREGKEVQILGLGFLIDNQLVGMTLFKRPPFSPSWVEESAASIHGLKIATPWQGNGLGHKAFELAVSKLKEEWPDVTKLMLGVDADNVAAIAVYHKYGMAKCASIREGADGPEYRFEITL